MGLLVGGPSNKLGIDYVVQLQGDQLVEAQPELQHRKIKLRTVKPKP